MPSHWRGRFDARGRSPMRVKGTVHPLGGEAGGRSPGFISFNPVPARPGRSRRTPPSGVLDFGVEGRTSDWHDFADTNPGALLVSYH